MRIIHRLTKTIIAKSSPGIKPCARCTAVIPLESYHRPAIRPRHWHEAYRTTNRVEVLHEQSPPSAVLELHDTTLMGVGAGRGVLVHGAEAELRAVFADAVFLTARHLRERGGMITVGLVGGNHARLIGTPYRLRPRAQRATVGTIVGRDEVVHAVNLIHVVALPHSVAFGNDGARRAILRAAHVGLQLRAFHFAVAMNGIHLPIVEQHRQVVDVTLHVVMLPRAMNVFCCVALQALAIHVRIDIELSVGIADARCPHALTVNLLVVLQREAVVGEVEAVEAIGDVLPVHEVLRVQDDQPGHGVHRRTGQIVVVAHAQDVGVGELVVEQRVGKRSVAVVGSP